MTVYADTDFFLALIKEDDWLQSGAKKRLDDHRGEIVTSIITVLEVLVVLRREGIDEPESVVADILEIADLQHVDGDAALQAALYMSDGATPFDAFHAALGDGPFLSSDAVYDELGLERIDLQQHGQRS